MAYEVKDDFDDLYTLMRDLNKLEDSLGMDLETMGRDIVTELSDNTPVRTGLTSKSWVYEIVEDKIRGERFIEIDNTNTTENGDSVAKILSYGTVTKDGRYRPGNNFIKRVLDNKLG